MGAGPAGLQAALILARACRTVVVIDSGRPRNEDARTLNGFLTRDGIRPAEFLALGRTECESYGVQFIDGKAISAAVLPKSQGFEVQTRVGELIWSRKLLLATGVDDVLPDVKGAEEVFGRALFVCPYCDGWERRGRKVAVWGHGLRGVSLAKFMLNWTPHVTLLVPGKAIVTLRQRQELKTLGVQIIRGTEWVFRLTDGGIANVQRCNVDGKKEDRLFDAIFFNQPSYGNAVLAKKLGCRLTKNQGAWADKRGRTSVPGCFAAGNLLRDVMLSIAAAGEGCQAAFELVSDLAHEDRDAVLDAKG